MAGLTMKKQDQSAGSRERLLKAATVEFAKNGLLGARVDMIARMAKTNKQLIYYHFGDKAGLYLAVLEHVYADIRMKERALNLTDSDAETAMVRLVGFTFDYVSDNREFVRLLTNENILKARHARRSKVIRQTRSPLVRLIEETLRRGVKAGLFRKGVDPVQLYISMAGLCFFYIANVHTLSVLFERDMEEKSALRERRAHAIAFVLGFLTNADAQVESSPGLSGRSRTPRVRVPAMRRVDA
jgi:TetR/AcrR family transcriptional regulator